MLTTSSPFAARMLFKLMLGSVRDDFTPTLWSGARYVYRGKKMWVICEHDVFELHVRFTPNSGRRPLPSK
jgi:hypothetical protein